MSEFLSGHEWHQSCVGRMLKCPRSFKLKYVDRLEPDFAVRGFVAPRGTAMHAAAEVALLAANRGEVATREAMREAMLAAFDDAIARGHGDGAQFDDERIGLALDQLEGEDLERMVRFAGDERLLAVDWIGVEEPYDLENTGTLPDGRPWSRRWRGVIDAHGVAKRYVEKWAQEGREWVALYPGERVLADWKSGTATPLGPVERAANVQLGIYSMALAAKYPGASWRPFIGQLRDLDPAGTPKDDEGRAIPKTLPQAVNPDFAAHPAVAKDFATKGIDPRDSKRKPRDEAKASIPKWLPEEINPEWEAARERPRGPLFRACTLDWGVIAETVSAAVRAAEAGLFPASGALTDQCRWCDFKTVCTQSTTDQEINQ